MTSLRSFITGFILLSLTTQIHGTEAAQRFEFGPPDSHWSVVTRRDYRVRINQKYLGFTNREIRESYRIEESLPQGWNIAGEVRILGATKKNGVPVAARLESEQPLKFFLGRTGESQMDEQGYPELRGFPTFPAEEIQPGDSWEAPLGVLVTGPGGEQAVLDQFASYRYLRSEMYQGVEAAVFEVAWAIRYSGGSPEVDFFLHDVEAAHRLILFVDLEQMHPIFARDKFVETWHWSDGVNESRDGFSLIFWKGVPPMDKVDIRGKIEEQLAGSFDEIQETPRGLSLILRSLHFQADAAVLVPEDVHLLDNLASLIANIDDRSVLVRGHAASVGKPEDEQQLSEQRAQYICNQIASRGVDPRRLIYEGVGSGEPIASNENEEGRRLNRRVEMIILED